LDFVLLLVFGRLMCFVNVLDLSITVVNKTSYTH